MAEELPWLGAYGGQTVGELLALAGRYRTDSILVAVEEALQRKAASLGEQRLSPAERTVLSVEALEREVNNGGYGQFLENESRGHSPSIVEALENIGCARTAQITRKALELAQDTHGEQLEDALDSCDRDYYATGEDIAGSLFSFIRARREEIVL